MKKIIHISLKLCCLLLAFCIPFNAFGIRSSKKPKKKFPLKTSRLQSKEKVTETKEAETTPVVTIGKPEPVIIKAPKTTEPDDKDKKAIPIAIKPPVIKQPTKPIPLLKPSDKDKTKPVVIVDTPPKKTTSDDKKPTTPDKTTDTTSPPTTSPQDDKAPTKPTEPPTTTPPSKPKAPETPTKVAPTKPTTPPKQEAKKETPQEAQPTIGIKKEAPTVKKKPAKPPEKKEKKKEKKPTAKPTKKLEKKPKKKEPTKPVKKEKKEPTYIKRVTFKPSERKDVLNPNLINFSFDNTPLSDVVNQFAEKKKVNVILPPKGLTEKVTFKPGELITLDEAQKYLYLFLNYAGYNLIPGESYLSVIPSRAAPRLEAPLFVFGNDSVLQPSELPDSDQIVRAIYYLKTLNIQRTATNPVYAVLSEILSKKENIILDEVLNSVVITDRSRIVRSAIELLKGLDAAGSDLNITTVQLYNASAASVVKLLREEILATTPQRGAPRGQTPTIVGKYFSTDIRVVDDPRRNTIIIIGKEAPVNRLKSFIREHMDSPIEAGKSVFHVYNLKYLDAQSFAGVLKRVITSTGLQDQQAAGQRIPTGSRRFFEGVAIQAETYQPVNGTGTTGTNGYNSGYNSGYGGYSGGNGFDSASTGTTGTVYRGGNRLIIAAQPSDWEQIKKLIDSLDVPQRQVILEVLIVDYTRLPQKVLETQFRNQERFDFKEGVEFQSAQLAGIQVAPENCSSVLMGQNLCPEGTTIAGDLLRLVGSDTTIISGSAPGSLIFSFNDPANTGIWGVLSLLNEIGQAKVLSHPYLVAINNTPAQITNSTILRSFGDSSSALGGAYNINVVDVPATLAVSITPRIASADRLNLEIFIDISQFSNEATQARNSRKIQTNINMSSPNQILVLGGLSRKFEQDKITSTPILGDIPLVGWLFRSNAKDVIETELGVFIRPTIIEPKIRKPMDLYTKRKIENETNDGLINEPIGNERDPIIRFFFGQERPEKEIIDDYLIETNNIEILKR